MEASENGYNKHLRPNEFAFIEFYEIPNGRLAYMKASRLPVWWVVQVAKLYNLDIEQTTAYWGGHNSKEWVQAALNYYEAFPDEINALIKAQEAVTYEQLKQRLPRLELVSVATTHE